MRTVTQAEKDKRRTAQAARRRSRGKRNVANAKPLPPPRPGSDQSFKEVKFAVLYDQPKERRHAWATAGDAAEIGRLLRLHAAQVGLADARQRVALTDGAPWIANQLEVNLPGLLDAHLLDFYHLAQHVHAAANACLGQGSDAAKAWAGARLHEAKHCGPTPVLAAVDALARDVRRSPAKREAVRLLRGFVAERLAMLRYPAARRRGWDIGSGPTEAAGKNMALRLRGVGMKWDLGHAADLMNLKALYESGQAKAYWSGQVQSSCLN